MVVPCKTLHLDQLSTIAADSEKLKPAFKIIGKNKNICI